MVLLPGGWIKLTIDSNFAINGIYHGNMAQQPIKFKVSIMVVTIDGKVTINGKFCAMRPMDASAAASMLVFPKAL